MLNDYESAKTLLSDLKKAYVNLPPNIQIYVASLLRECSSKTQDKTSTCADTQV